MTTSHRPRLRVTFLYKNQFVYSRVYSESYAVKKMSEWYAKGPEYRCQNSPVGIGRVRRSLTRWEREQLQRAIDLDDERERRFQKPYKSRAA